MPLTLILHVRSANLLTITLVVLVKKSIYSPPVLETLVWKTWADAPMKWGSGR
jgi:hypothetical protein